MYIPFSEILGILLILLRTMIGKAITTVNDLYWKLTKHDELQFIDELRKAFQQIPVEEINNCLPSEPSWRENINTLRKLVAEGNPKEFLRWNPIRRTMFISNASFVSQELKHLKRQGDWRKRWRGAIRESRVGHPIPFWLYPVSSGNLITHAYHLIQFERSIGRNVDKLGFVFEFGGGYGSMCRLFYNLGYKGKYLIFDLPEFSALQRSYLSSIGLPVYEVSLFMSSRGGISCISEIDELRAIMNNIIQHSGMMFISTWAISETPESLRNLIIPLISNFDYLLIGYQAKYREINNIELFERWKTVLTGIQWKEWEIKHLPDNYYLIGKRLKDRS
jgi:hypothetical protein